MAPYTCRPLPTVVSFVFPETIGNDPLYTAETAVQEAAHGWGLDHSFVCEDPMTYLEGCGPKSFQDGDYACGEYEARSCACGNDTQNTYQHILGLFGPAMVDEAPPSVSITAPANGSVFESGESFEVTVEASDGYAVMSVELYVDDALVATDEVSPFGGWPISDAPPGTLEFRARAFDTAGNMADSATVTVTVADLGGSGGESDGSTGSAEASGADGGATTDEAGCGCRSGFDARGQGLLVLLLLGSLGPRRGGPKPDTWRRDRGPNRFFRSLNRPARGNLSL